MSAGCVVELLLQDTPTLHDDGWNKKSACAVDGTSPVSGNGWKLDSGADSEASIDTTIDGPMDNRSSPASRVGRARVEDKTRGIRQQLNCFIVHSHCFFRFRD